MTDQSPAAVGTVPAAPARLEPDAIGVAQDTVIGMASSAPAASVGLTLAAVAAASAYGSGPVILLTAIPMLVIANAYHRLNMWNANAGASFEWVGRAGALRDRGDGHGHRPDRPDRLRHGQLPGLPEFLATISRRSATPVAASVLVGLLIVGLTWVYRAPELPGFRHASSLAPYAPCR